MSELASETIGTGQRAMVYARQPQYNEHDRTTIEEQLRACLAVAATLGYSVAAEAIVEENTPNSSLARPGITRLITILAQGEADALITHSLDRLGRIDSEGLEALVRELRRRKVAIYVGKVPKGYRYDPPTGKLLHDPALIAAANREDARPPEYIVIPRETEQGEMMADFQALRGLAGAANGEGHGGQG